MWNKDKTKNWNSFPPLLFSSLNFTSPFPIPLPPPSHIPIEQCSGRRMGVAVSSLQFLSATSSISLFSLLLHGSLARAAVPQDKPASAWFSCPGPQHLLEPCSCEGSPWMQLPLGRVHLCQCGVLRGLQCEYLLHHGPLLKLQGNTCFPMVFSRLCREHLLPLRVTHFPSLLTVEQCFALKHIPPWLTGQVVPCAGSILGRICAWHSAALSPPGAGCPWGLKTPSTVMQPSSLSPFLNRRSKALLAFFLVFFHWKDLSSHSTKCVASSLQALGSRDPMRLCLSAFSPTHLRN